MAEQTDRMARLYLEEIEGMAGDVGRGAAGMPSRAVQAMLDVNRVAMRDELHDVLRLAGCGWCDVAGDGLDGVTDEMLGAEIGPLVLAMIWEMTT